MNINQRIEKLRQFMKKRGLTVYIVPTSDFHQSEYVSEYFKARQFITGFTGSAGTAVITMEEACLWTDGRYFIQAAHELEGTEVKLCRIGMEGVPELKEYVKEHLTEKGGLGFDGRVMSAKDGEYYHKLTRECGASLYTEEDLIGEIWEERPGFPISTPFVLETKYAGKTVKEKIEEVRNDMEKKGADYHILNDACDIAWLLNIRGNDISHVPVILSYLILDGTHCFWYVKQENITPELRTYLDENNITVKDYEDIYEDLGEIQDGIVLADLGKINYNMKASLTVPVKDERNPEESRKAVKNGVEVENIRNAHIKDGVAVTKFMYWLKQTIGKETITEMDAARYMDKLREELSHYVDISFDTIAAYGENAAMMHYEPNEEHNAVLQPRGFLLVDSGGHYLEGSTDITRTFALGPISKEERLMFTTVVRSNLILANAKFLYGCTGRNLDILAREPLWQMGIDYRCGTGHGNGYLLNVHEGPNAFRWRKLSGAKEEPALEEGMITTDEPGVYVEGKYGIRIENELLCKKAEKNEYGQFMEFENITYAPIDLDAIDPSEMTSSEKRMLNDYHKKVYDVVAPYLNNEEKEWLKKYTEEI